MLQIKTLFITLLCLFVTALAIAQQPYVHVIHPYKTVIKTTKSRNYLSGNTCKGCTLFIDGKKIKVYPTGAFAVELNLKEGDSTVTLTSTNASGITKTKKLAFQYHLPPTQKPVKDFQIVSVNMQPSRNSWVMPGDRIQFKIKAQPGNEISIGNKIDLYELPAGQTNGIAGTYQGTHLVTAHDPLLNKNLLIKMKNRDNKTSTRSLAPKIRVLDPATPIIGKTSGAFPYLEFGKGTDRLGGAKINYLDTAVLLHITGLFDGKYRVELAPGRHAYIPERSVTLLSKGVFIPNSLSHSWRVWGDDKFDYVSISLNKKLPYTTYQQINPSRIVIDIYGATANSNWITQLQSAKEIKNVWYEQVSDGILRATIELKHPQHWGYHIAYQENQLTIKVKRQPRNLSLSHLSIAIDAGHGGSNRGAQGPTGVFEKTLTLQISKKLKGLLEKAGTRVIMTRTTDKSESMIERRTFLEKENPDLLVSIHLNSSADPIHISGTSTYYRYIGFRPLSRAILTHMLGLGLADFGNIGRFNFALNGPTEYPNALVETLFISNPADEMKALNPAFQQRIAEAIKAGIQDFLKQAKQNNQ